MAQMLGGRRSSARAGSGRRRAWRTALAALVVGVLSVTVVASPAAAEMPATSVAAQVAAAGCTGSALSVVAHPDDDLLFLNPHIRRDIDAKRCTRTVYVTAGEAGDTEAYWSRLESGIRATYARMAGVANSWTAADAGISAGRIQIHTLTGAPHVSVVFLRIPDGFDGSGSAAYGQESLAKLWNGQISTITTVDDREWYTKTEVRNILRQLMADFDTTTVRSHDWTTNPNNLDDHSDHWASAMFTQLASRQYTAGHTLLAYEAYPTRGYPENVAGNDLANNIDAFVKFADYDKNLCNNPYEGCPDSPYDLWLERQYLVSVESTKNTARESGATVAASSSKSTAQGAEKAKDGYSVGAPFEPEKEWVSNGEKAGAWIQYSFAAPTPLDGVTLFDRPDLANQITGAALAFSDGTSVPVAALPNNGSGVTIRFPVRTVTSVRLNITAVSGTTTDVGVAEFEAWRGPADTTPPIVTASPTGGVYPVGQPITLSANETASIFYTTDGTVPTTSSTRYTGPITMSAGFTLRYLGVDTAGNASAPAQQVYTVPAADTTAPVVTASPPGGRFEVGQKIGLSSNEPAQIRFTVDGSTPTTGSPLYTAPITLTTAFTLRFFGVDAAGNASSPVAETYSVPGPPAIIAPTEGQTVGRSVTIQLQGDPDSTFSCTADPAGGGQPAPCASGDVLTFTTEGSHALVVTATDSGGIVSPPTQVTFTVSFAAPAPVITVPSADGAVLTSSPSFAFSSPGDTNVAFRCKLDTAAFAACTSPRGYTGLTAGAHTFTVEATNALGNTGTASRAFTVVLPDTTAPVVTATPVGGTYPAGQQIALSANEPATIRFTVDGSAPTTSSPVYSGPLTLTTAFVLRYLAVDTAGNQSAAGSQSYTVRPDATGPSHDFDGDGNADVMARDHGGNLWLHGGNGAGGWFPARQVGTGWNIMTAILMPGDFNGDDTADVLARDGGGRLILYPGNGSGGWRTPVQVGSGWNIMKSIIGPGDFNGDGNVDVLAVDTSYRMILYPGNGRGGWLGPVQVGSGWGIMTAVIGPGDFNGDGAVDVLARASGGSLYLYPGNGSGGWLPRSLVGGGWGAMTAIIGPGDFDGDGANDVLARTSVGTLLLYRGDGIGGLKPSSQIGTGWNAFSAIM